MRSVDLLLQSCSSYSRVVITSIRLNLFGYSQRNVDGGINFGADLVRPTHWIAVTRFFPVHFARNHKFFKIIFVFPGNVSKVL